ncbi:MAG: hypothetical protein MI922_14220, partial [Bacteroidales bacterium]|nr:hypothetical protein [Bacteroidales bacterium]
DNETFLPLEQLNLKSNLKTFLENQNVIYVSRTNCLLQSDLMEVKNMGKKKIYDINFAISSYFYDNGIKDPSEYQEE